MRRSPIRVRLIPAVAAVAIAIAGCTFDAVTPGGGPSQIVVWAGDGQQGTVKSALPVPVQFRVLDAAGHPVPRVQVMLTIRNDAGRTAEDAVTTDNNGFATFTWTLAAAPGVQQLEARVGSAIPARATAIACLPDDCVASPPDETRLLPITTYDGSGQVVHPDVAIGAGTLPGYWLAITPYPNGNANYENPSILSGIDGRNWTVPTGLTNPVARSALGGYLSDPDVVWDPGTQRLWLYYREVATGQNIIRLKRSDDGVRWDDPVTVATAPSHQIISPTVVRGAPGAPWTMWSVNSGPAGCTAQGTTVERRTSSDGIHWNAPAATDLAQPGEIIWHIDVEWIPARSAYWAIYNTYPTGGTCVTDALYLAESADGVHWTTHPSPIVRRGVLEAFDDIVYRSSFQVDPAGGSVTLWVSGATFTAATGYTWSAALLRRRISELLATAEMPYSGIKDAPRRNLPPPEPDVGPGG